MENKMHGDCPSHRDLIQRYLADIKKVPKYEGDVEADAQQYATTYGKLTGKGRKWYVK